MDIEEQIELVFQDSWTSERPTENGRYIAAWPYDPRCSWGISGIEVKDGMYRSLIRQKEYVWLPLPQLNATIFASDTRWFKLPEDI